MLESEIADILLLLSLCLVELHGIHKQASVGFLTLMESLRYCKVLDFWPLMKSPCCAVAVSECWLVVKGLFGADWQPTIQWAGFIAADVATKVFHRHQQRMQCEWVIVSMWARYKYKPVMLLIYFVMTPWNQQSVFTVR